VLEREAVGGQAGSSSMIRNYLGFPCGISGASLANRAFEQAWSFGVTPAVAGPVTALRPGAVPAAALVVLIGAVPRTGWLPASIRCDRQDAPRRARPPGRGRRFLAERDAGKRALGDRSPVR
jgi:hypothetical protein